MCRYFRDEEESKICQQEQDEQNRKDKQIWCCLHEDFYDPGPRAECEGKYKPQEDPRNLGNVSEFHKKVCMGCINGKKF